MKKFSLLLLIIFVLSLSSVFAAAPYSILNPYNAVRIFHLDNSTGTTNSIIVDSTGTENGTGVNLETSDLITNTMVNGFETAMKFDGVNEKIDTNWGNGDITVCSPMSFAAWVNVSETGTGYFASSQDGAASHFLNFLYDVADNNTFKLNIYTNGGAQLSSTRYGGLLSTLKDGSWHHLAIVHEAGCDWTTSTTLYLDGIEKSITSKSSGTSTDSTLNGDLYISARNAGGEIAAEQEVDDFLIFADALTAEEVAIIAGLDDTTPPTIIQINFTSDGGWICPAWPAECNQTTDDQPSFDLTIDETGNCSMSTIDEDYTDMNNTCTGSPSTLLSCTQDTPLSVGSHTLYFACADNVFSVGYIFDSFTRPNSASVGGNWTESETGASTTNITDNKLVYYAVSGSNVWLYDYEIGNQATFDVTMEVNFTVINSAYLGFCLNRDAGITNPPYIANTGNCIYWAGGADNKMYLYTDGGSALNSTLATKTAGTNYIIRFAYDGTESKVKYWDSLSSEPSDWTIKAVSALADGTKMALTMEGAGSTTNIYVDNLANYSSLTGNYHTAPLPDTNKVNITILATDTCTCPAVPQNYTINITDECFFNTPCDIGTYNLSVVGETGNVSINTTFIFGHLFQVADIKGVLYPNAKINQSIT